MVSSISLAGGRLRLRSKSACGVTRQMHKYLEIFFWLVPRSTVDLSHRHQVFWTLLMPDTLNQDLSKKTGLC